ncbi:hypothetical protein AB1Y20_020034 [Prymnesium parvum]|uniref:RING-type domain-containing protein n=1 Tax=Prymnesium parvum TaxID=97485 RepID=A0AB34JVY6_PRYPA
MEAAHLRYQIHNDEATGEAEQAEKERPGGSEEQQEEPREREEHASHTPPESQANAQVQRGELQCGEAQCGEASTSTSASTKHADPPPTVVSVSCTVRAPDVDCIICYEQLATAPTSSLHCGHLFHKTCIDEWIEKDGRCPICRHQEREVARARPGDPADRDASLTAEQLELGRPDDEEPRPAHPWQLAALVISSHRLMALSAIEGLLSVVVMAYSNDVFFPLLMLTTAFVLFYGASQFQIRLVALARPLLMMNAVLHLMLMMRILHTQNVRAVAADNVLISMAIVAFLELTLLRKATAYVMFIRAFSDSELARLRLARGTRFEWKHRAALMLLTAVIFLPVVLQRMCSLHDQVHEGMCGNAH